MDRHVRAIVSHRLPNAEELKTGCGDWLECCQAYIHRDSCVTTKPLEPCPKCLDSKALTKWKDAEVSCGRCGFNAPFDVWQSRACISPASTAPVVDNLVATLESIEFNAPECECEHDNEYCCVAVGEFCARCWAHVALVDYRAAAATAAPVDLEKCMAEPKSDTELICVNCGREIVMSEYGPPINDICWSHTHNGVVWCNLPTSAAPVEHSDETLSANETHTDAISRQEAIKVAKLPCICRSTECAPTCYVGFLCGRIIGRLKELPAIDSAKSTRAAAEEICKYLNAFTPLSPGEPLIRIFEEVIKRHRH